LRAAHTDDRDALRRFGALAAFSGGRDIPPADLVLHDAHLSCRLP
jgi:hypothetical protein